MKKFIMMLMKIRPWDEEEEDPVVSPEEQVVKDADDLESKLENMGGPDTLMPGEVVEPDPVEPVVDPVEPVVDPVEPVVTPVEPVVTPVEPVVAPVVEPVVEPVVTPVEPAPRPPMSADDVFGALVKAKNNELDGGDDVNSRALSLASGIVQQMSVEEVMSVIKKAQANEYGNSSADFLLEAKDALSIVQANTHIAHTKAEEGNRLKAEFDNRVRQTTSSVSEDPKFKDLKDPESDMSKFMTQWREKNIGVVDEAKNVVVSYGPLHSILQNPDWPRLVANLMHNEFQASGTDSLKQTIEELRQKDKDLTPLPSTRRSVSSAKGNASVAEKEADELEKRLSGMGNMG